LASEKKVKKEKEDKSGFRFRHVFLIIIVLLLLLSLFSHRASDLTVLEGGSQGAIKNWIGPAGAHTARMLLYLFGLSAYPLLTFLIICALRPLISIPTQRKGYLGALIAVMIGTVMLFAMWPQKLCSLTEKAGIGRAGTPFSALSGGVLGQKLAAPEKSVSPGVIRTYIGTIGTGVVAVVFLLTGAVFIWLADWQQVWLVYLEKRRDKSSENEEKSEREKIRDKLRSDREKRREGEPAPTPPEPEIIPEPQTKPITKPVKPSSAAQDSKAELVQEIDDSKYELPPVSLLEKVKTGAAESKDFIQESKEILQATLDSFGIDATVTGAVVGPRVTRFEISPEPGVKVEKISALSNNIAMDLQAKSIRIQAPIPGKNAVGVEAPNRTASSVSIRAMMESAAWQESRAEIPIILGKDVAGNVIVADLTKTPHLLIAGATGSGKSVCLSAIIKSLLYRFTPAELKLIMVDPKVVEFEPYKPLPHLITPVVSDAKKVPMALRWAINEMERRYKLLAKTGVRNLSTFNARPPEKEPLLDDDDKPIPAKLPYVVIIIDELADIMMMAKAEVETSIARIAQKARAVGIHMVLATQTPRKDIITGVIKANLPSRIAFRVMSIIDSRVILDQKGAETLLGRGDMLFIPPGSPNSERIQGAWVSDKDIENVVKYVSKQMDQQFTAGVTDSSEIDEEGISAGDPAFATPAVSRFLQPGDDENLRKAIEIILTERKASTSYIQRRLKIGYNRAADIIDTLEQREVIGPQPSSGANREILAEPEGDFIPDGND